MIRIVNKLRYEGQGDAIHRPYPLGNPYSHKPNTLAQFKVESRYDAVMAYDRDWLPAQLASDTPAKREFDRLVKKYIETGELTLICYCVPQACHGNLLKKRIEDAAKLANELKNSEKSQHNNNAK